MSDGSENGGGREGPKRARSRLRELEHVHSTGSEVGDAQAWLRDLVGRSGAHLTGGIAPSLDHVGRHAVSDDTSTSENGGGREGPKRARSPLRQLDHVHSTGSEFGDAQAWLRGLGRVGHTARGDGVCA